MFILVGFSRTTLHPLCPPKSQFFKEDLLQEDLFEEDLFKEDLFEDDLFEENLFDKDLFEEDLLEEVLFEEKKTYIMVQFQLSKLHQDQQTEDQTLQI